MRTTFFLLIILASCTVPDKASLKVIRQTRKMQYSPPVLTASNRGKLTNDKWIIRENNSFSYESQTIGTQKIVIYAGLYKQTGDTLYLLFQNNHKDSAWTNKAVINRAAHTITILAKDPSLNKQLIIKAVK